MNLRRFARGQQCTLQIPGVCNGNSETVVLAHGRGAGMATKLVDYIGVHACAACHAHLDTVSTDEYHRLFPRALLRTLERLSEANLI